MEVERCAVVEETPPLGIEWHEVEMIFQFTARLGVDPLEHPGDGEDCRAHIKAKALLSQHGRLAANPSVLVAERDGIAASSQRAGRR